MTRPISNTILDQHGLPVAGALVTIWDEAGDLVLLAGGNPVISNHRGAWFADLDAGDYTIEIKKGSTTLSRVLTVCAEIIPLPPSFTINPSISGGPLIGATLTCDPGEWTGEETIIVAFQWRRDGVAIVGATSSTYLLDSADDGTDIDCLVTLTNDYGEDEADSNDIYAGTIPVCTVAPTISGTDLVGSLMTCNPGTWTGTDVVLSYQWRRDGVNIALATASTYTTVSGDDGKDLDCVVTGNNVFASVSADSNDIPIGTVPVNTVAPVASGGTTTGSILSCTTGTWTGTAPIGYTYQWRRDGVNIGGETASSYVLALADDGTDIDCVVTATNDFGTDDADSNVIAAVAYDISTITLPEALTGPIYWSPDSGDFYFPMRTIIRRHNPVTLANTDFTPTNYSAPAVSVGLTRIMRKSATRLLISNKEAIGTLRCIEIDDTNATIASVAITNNSSGNPVSLPAWFYDSVADRLFAPFVSGAGLNVGTYKSDNSAITPSSPGFGTVNNMAKFGTELALTQPATTTTSFSYKGTISAWNTVSTLGTNNSPSCRILSGNFNADAIVSDGTYYYYCGDNVAGGGDFIIKINPVTPSHTRHAIFSGGPTRNYMTGSMCIHSGFMFLQASSGSFCILDLSDMSVTYEDPFSGGDISTAGQIACDPNRKLVYHGNTGSVTMKRFAGLYQ